jgi:hypothetical protein
MHKDLSSRSSNGLRGLAPAGLLLLGAALASIGLPRSASGQLASDAPRLLGPYAPTGFGLYWLRAGALPGDGNAGLVTWAPPGLQGALTLRAGAGRGVGGSAAGFGGIDLRVPMAQRRLGAPIDVSWTAGVGVSVGEYLMGTLPMGVSVGREWASGSVFFAPYVSAGLAFDMRVFEEAPEPEFVVQPAAEVGVDLSLDPARRVTLRAGASLGDREAVAVGAIVRAGR